MASKLDKTLADYVVIAISPALIMLLIGSLILFLIQVFYQGSYMGRLEYIFILFVIGSVLVGRISIEQGREYSLAFAFPLGLVTLIAINRFAEFQGPLASFSFVINCGLIALVGWAADKLTWDCTLVDEDEEDPGEGLLESVGLEKSSKTAMQKDIAPATQLNAGSVPENVATTTSSKGRPTTWWGRYVERRRRPHAPGVWVVYFSLAALPLFGLGQLFIKSDDLSARQYAFVLLCVYTGSGLALLLTTSFLGLRRYLRQHRIEMPLTMVNLWLGTGGVLIAGVMFIAMLIPRPNAEYPISEVPFQFGSPDQHSSRFGQGSDGVHEKKSYARSEKSDEKSKNQDSVKSDQAGNTPSQGPKNTSPDGKSSTPSQSQDQDKNKQDQQGKTESKSSEKQGEAGEKSENTKQGEASKQTDSQKSPEKAQEKGKPTEPGKQNDLRKASEGEKEKPSNPPAEQKSSKKHASDKDVTDKQKADKDKSQDSKETANKSSEATKAPQTPTLPPRSFSMPTIPPMMDLFKWIFYAVIFCAIVAAIWFHREALLNALHQFGQWWHDFLQRLFGGGRHRVGSEDAAALPKKLLRRFVDFHDPFAQGTAGNYSPEELVQYTFEALEAWARDHGYPREPEQTPHEFARNLGSHVAVMADDAKRLADLYCQAAYAHGTLSAKSVAHLSRMWQTMNAETAWVA
jgi:hypothetical protein